MFIYWFWLYTLNKSPLASTERKINWLDGNQELKLEHIWQVWKRLILYFSFLLCLLSLWTMSELRSELCSYKHSHLTAKTLWWSSYILISQTRKLRVLGIEVYLYLSLSYFIVKLSLHQKLHLHSASNTFKGCIPDNLTTKQDNEVWILSFVALASVFWSCPSEWCYPLTLPLGNFVYTLTVLIG